MRDEELKGVVESLTSWMHFEAACGRSRAFSEKYLVPAAVSLLTMKYRRRIRTELPHPVLKSRERVDFAVIDKAGNWKLAIETKWLSHRVRRSDTGLTRLVKDILRLELIAREKNCPQCWLLIAGKTSSFRNLWYENSNYGDTGRYKHVAAAFMPALPSKIGWNPGIRYADRPEPSEWAPMREYMRKACTHKSFEGLAVGRAFMVVPALPFPTLCGDDAKRLSYSLPPHEYAVYGWQIEPAERTMTVHDLLSQTV